jgi:hypothetical protein
MRSPALLPLAILVLHVLSVRPAAGAVIPVTTLTQKISASGGCSLQEAIYSANSDSNSAISGYSGTMPKIVVTQCVPGSGDDIIVLPTAAVMQMSTAVDDPANPTGPTATPLITSTITILAYGSTLERVGSGNFRLFAVGLGGHLTIRRAYIRGFRAQGGDGNTGGGGGLGAGGAIYVTGGVVVIEASTFEGNGAFGGTGGSGIGGGGGGMGGHGAWSNTISGAGGGGARGNGAAWGRGAETGGGGGGTVANATGLKGGFDCGGDGGLNASASGEGAVCGGGGGGGGGGNFFILPGEDGTDGGRGGYGGGGGGGAEKGDGGSGGFGGGGGASGSAWTFGEDGGNGGFGGGGGAGNNGLITDGDGGNGGFFAGDGSSSGGGGGAGLGGAIFNESGTVDVRNSTFADNVVSGGFSERTQDGISGGGAIFSINGHLTVLDSTIAGHIAHVGSGILVAQTIETEPMSFVLHNTIVAGNSMRECAITGFSVAVSFTGNLITSNADGTTFDGKTFVGCGGIVTSDDPQLGPLQINDGPTPTMAIATSSPAWNAADPDASLPVDQRRQDRPAMGGFDIGAFELCLEGFGRLQQPCLILAAAEDPTGTGHTVPLTIAVQPQGGGTTTPAPGTRQVAQDTVMPLSARPNMGYRFTGWSGHVTSPLDRSTTVVMNSSQTVIANFALCTCALDVTKSMTISYGGVTLNPVTRRYVQTVTFKNTSASTIAGPISFVLDLLTSGVTLYNASGATDLVLPSGSPYVNASINLASGQSTSIQLQFTNPANGVFSYQGRVLAGPGSR